MGVIVGGGGGAFAPSIVAATDVGSQMESRGSVVWQFLRLPMAGLPADSEPPSIV